MKLDAAGQRRTQALIMAINQGIDGHSRFNEMTLLQTLSATLIGFEFWVYVYVMIMASHLHHICKYFKPAKLRNGRPLHFDILLNRTYRNRKWRLTPFWPILWVRKYFSRIYAPMQY